MAVFSACRGNGSRDTKTTNTGKNNMKNEQTRNNRNNERRPERSPCAIVVGEDGRAMRLITCEFDGHPAYMLKLLRACYRTREEALSLVRAGDMVSIDFCLDFCEQRETEDGSVGASRAVPYRADAVLAAAKGCGHIFAFDGETRLWHAWNAAGWHVEEDPFAPDFADMVEHLRIRAEQAGGDEVLPF